MEWTIVTMSRGDEARAEEWVSYHAALGFTRFHVVLDNPIDDTAGVLERAARHHGLDLAIEERGAIGEYFDGLSPADRYRRVVAWRAENRPELAARELPINDPLAWRQFHHLPAVLAGYVERGDGWLALIDMDEFLVLPGTLEELVAEHTASRLRFLSFDFDTSGYEPSKPVLEQHTMRWSHAGLETYGKGWERRTKAMVRYECALPLDSVHAVSKGQFKLLDHTRYRLHHFRVPCQGAEIAYDTLDLTTREIASRGGRPAG